MIRDMIQYYLISIFTCTQVNTWRSEWRLSACREQRKRDSISRAIAHHKLATFMADPVTPYRVDQGKRGETAVSRVGFVSDVHCIGKRWYGGWRSRMPKRSRCIRAAFPPFLFSPRSRADLAPERSKDHLLFLRFVSFLILTISDGPQNPSRHISRIACLTSLIWFVPFLVLWVRRGANDLVESPLPAMTLTAS
jgi:hypothetical protein